MKRYAVEQLDTGLYFGGWDTTHRAVWEEEPVWMGAAEAQHVVRHPSHSRDPSPLAVREFEFDPSECE